MKCPFCGCIDSQVKDSRPTEDYSGIRRRRVCPECGSRFTTFEQVQLKELTVLKKDGEKVPFDRSKLARSIQLAVRKRQIDSERIEKVINSIVRQLETLGETEISTQKIGLLVMDSLLVLDKISYIRYASVYKNFTTPKDFEDLMSEIIEKKEL